MGHSSGMPVARHLMRPTRGSSRGGPPLSPAWPCSGWGLPCPGGYPHGRWALTPPFHPYRQPHARAPAAGGLFSVALSVGFRRPGVTRHPALRSSDFPRIARPVGTDPRPFAPLAATGISRPPSAAVKVPARRLDFRPLYVESIWHPLSRVRTPSSGCSPGCPEGSVG